MLVEIPIAWSPEIWSTRRNNESGLPDAPSRSCRSRRPSSCGMRVRYFPRTLGVLRERRHLRLRPSWRYPAPRLRRDRTVWATPGGRDGAPGRFGRDDAGATRTSAASHPADGELHVPDVREHDPNDLPLIGLDSRRVDPVASERRRRGPAMTVGFGLQTASRIALEAPRDGSGGSRATPVADDTPKAAGDPSKASQMDNGRFLRVFPTHRPRVTLSVKRPGRRAVSGLVGRT